MTRKRLAAVTWLALAMALAGCGDTVGLAIGPAASGGVTVPETLLALDVHGGGMACAAGDGALYIRSPSAQAWRAIPLSPGDRTLLQGLRLSAVLCLNPDNVLAAGSTHGAPPAPRIVLFTRGAPWRLQHQQLKPQGELLALARAGGRGAIAVGYREEPKPGTGYRSWSIVSEDPVKGNWKDEPGLTYARPLRTIWVRPDGQRVAAGDSGLLLHSPGPGKPYTQETSPFGAATLRAAWAPGTGPFLLAGDSGAMITRVTGGTWKSAADPQLASVNWRALHGTSASDRYAVGGQVLAHHDGNKWLRIKEVSGLPATLDLRAVRLESGATPGRLHLAGDGLLATCAITAGSPPQLTCGP